MVALRLLLCPRVGVLVIVGRDHRRHFRIRCEHVGLGLAAHYEVQRGHGNLPLPLLVQDLHSKSDALKLGVDDVHNLGERAPLKGGRQRRPVELVAAAVAVLKLPGLTRGVFWRNAIARLDKVSNERGEPGAKAVLAQHAHLDFVDAHDLVDLALLHAGDEVQLVLWPDDLQDDLHVPLSCPRKPLHGQGTDDVRRVLLVWVRAVLVREHEAGLGLRQVTPLQVLVLQAAPLNVDEVRLVRCAPQDPKHLVTWVLWAQDHHLHVGVPMVLVQELLEEVHNPPVGHRAADHDMRVCVTGRVG